MKLHIKLTLLILFLFLLTRTNVLAQQKQTVGIASYYADKFVGRTTANGEKYKHTKLGLAEKVPGALDTSRQSEDVL